MFAFGLCFMVFPDGSDGKESACNGRAPGAVPRSGRSSEEGNGYPLQYSCLENSMENEPVGLQSWIEEPGGL